MPSAKRKRKKLRELEGVEGGGTSGAFGNTATVHPLAATGVDSGSIPGTSIATFGRDATNIPTLHPTEEELSAPVAYAQTPSALADKHIFSREPEFILLVLVVVGIIGMAGIDNYQGRLMNTNALIFLVWKILTLVGLVCGAILLYAGFRKVKAWLS